jgi:hypothetical protein
VIKRLPELKRVHQGLAAPVVPVQLVQAVARDQKRGDPLAVVSNPDSAKIPALAQKERPPEDIRGLKADQKITPFKKFSCHQYVPLITDPFRPVKHLLGLTVTY